MTEINNGREPFGKASSIKNLMINGSVRTIRVEMRSNAKPAKCVRMKGLN